MLGAGAIDVIQFEFGEAQINSRTFFRDIYQVLSPGYQIHRIPRRGLAALRSYNEIREIYRTSNYLAISTAQPKLFDAFGVKQLA
jgi:hypothetical protein